MSDRTDRAKNVLWKREEKIVCAFTEVLLEPPREEFERVKQRFLDSLNAQLGHLPFDKRMGFRLCLWMFEVAAITYYGSLKCMTRLSREKRSRYIRAWHDTWWSVKRVIKRFVEALATMNYYAIPEVGARIGYAPRFNAPLPTPAFPPERLVTAIPDKDVRVEADVCVIGSGAGGAAVAKELAEAGRSVVVLEEGAWHDVGEFGNDTATMTRLLYRDAGAVNTYGWPVIIVPVGCCVGGTTLINSATCFRAPDYVLKRWVDEFGLPGWEPARMAPYFEKVEKIIGVEPAKDEVQGRSGPIVKRGFAKLGHELKPVDRNVPQCCGSGACVQGCPTNAKQSTQISYLPRAMNVGATVYTRVRATRITCRGRHATEVAGRFIDPASGAKGPRLRVNAKVVVAACGTLYTPLLLARSRIPNPSGQRGLNLTLHPASKVYGLFDEEVRGWEGIPQGFYSDALVKEGIKFEGVFLSPAFTASTILLMGKEHRQTMEQYSHLACFGLMVSDDTMGRVYRGVEGSPIIWYNINTSDLKKYQRGYEFLVEAMFAAGAKKVFPGIKTLPMITREQGAKAIEKLHLRNKDLDLQAFHPLGTCQMGADPRQAVTDGWGRVYGMDNLFIADGSLFPTSLGVNPMVSIMAAATKVADHIDKEQL